MIRYLIAIAIGASLGGVIGYLGQCSTGVCPLTSTWWGGALFGGLLGLFFAQTFVRVPATPADLVNVHDITSVEAFDSAQKIAQDRQVLVDFYLPSCGPCRSLMPEIYHVARAHPDTLMVLKVHAGKVPELATRFSVTAVPFLVHMHKGEVQNTATGFMTRNALEQWLFDTPVTFQAPDA